MIPKLISRFSVYSGLALALASLSSPLEAKPWKGAEVISKQTFKYGAFEARIRAAKGGGIITPFFLWKDGSEVAGAKWQEQDFEIFGRDGTFQTQVMTPGNPRVEHVMVHYPQTPAYDRYNTYRMEWTPDSISFYFNGTQIRKETDKTEFAKLLDPAQAEPAQLRVSNWAGDYEWSGAFDSTAVPADVFVNWIQTYSYTPGAGPGGSNFTPLWRDDFDSWDNNRWWTANWTFAEAINDYVPENATVAGGALNIAFTHWTRTGTFRPVPPDDGLTPPPTVEPVLDTAPLAVPGRLPATAYARALEQTPGNSGDPSCTSRDPDVDLDLSADTLGGLCNVSWTLPGEWLEYDLQVDSAGRYEIGLNLASAQDTIDVGVLLDGVVLSAALPVPADGWQAFRTVALPSVDLSKGKHTLRVVFNTGYANLHYLDVQPALALPPVATTGTTSDVFATGATVSGSVLANRSSTTDSVQYGTTTAYDTTVAATPGLSTGAQTTSIQAVLTGLLPQTTYHYRVKAVNAFGTSYGADSTFTTPAEAQEQSIAFEAPAPATYGTEFVKLAGVASSGLPVRYASANPAAVRISQDTAYLLAADTATITASQEGDANHAAATPVSRVLTIARKALSIAGAKASDKVYDGTTSASVTGASLSGVVGTDTVNLVLGTASFANKDTGSAKAVTVTGSTLSGAQAGNYGLTEVSGLAARISPKPIAVVAAARSKVYGSSDPALTYTAPALLGSDAFTGSLARAMGENAGKYAITQGTLSAGGNYAVAFTGDSLTIGKKTLTISGAKASDKVYDGTISASATGASLSGVVGTDTVNLVLGTVSFANKDTGTAKAVTVTGSTLSGAQAGNYSLTEVSGLAARISPKPIAVVAAAKSKVYGSSDPALTYTAPALLGSDAFTGSLARATGENAGKYAITKGTLTAGGNYAVTFTGDSLTISKKALSIAGAKASDKVYDGTTSAAVTGASLSGVVGTDAVSLVLGTASFANKDTGTAKVVTVTGSTLSGAQSGNYSLTEVSGLAARISPKPIAVVAAAKSKVYGSSDPALTYTAPALLGGDAFTGSLSRAAGENAGKYAITQGTLTAGGNYAVAFTGDSLTIGKKTLTISGAKVSVKVYDGTTSAAVTGASLSGVVGTDAVTLVLGAASFSNPDAGSGKVVTVSGSKLSGSPAGNYGLTEVSGLTGEIVPKPIEVVAAAKTKIAGASDPVLTYAATALVGTDTWSGALKRDAGETVGTYPIRLGTLSAGANYEIAFTGADLAITQTTAIAVRPVRPLLSRGLEANALRLFAEPSTRSSSGRLEPFPCADDDISCLSVDILLPGASRVSVAIFDNLGTPVISFERDLSKTEFQMLSGIGGGRRVLPVSWNLRARGGAAVEPGVFLWRIVVETVDGQRLETVKRLGVKRR